MSIEQVAYAIQGIKANALNNTSLLLDALPAADKAIAIDGVRKALSAVAVGSIACPADLHAFNCSNLEKAGWRHGAIFRPLKSQTPLLRPFHALPGELRELITRCYEVLKAAADASPEFASRNAPTGNFTTTQS